MVQGVRDVVRTTPMPQTALSMIKANAIPGTISMVTEITGNTSVFLSAVKKRLSEISLCIESVGHGRGDGDSVALGGKMDGDGFGKRRGHSEHKRQNQEKYCPLFSGHSSLFFSRLRIYAAFLHIGDFAMIILSFWLMVYQYPLIHVTIPISIFYIGQNSREVIAHVAFRNRPFDQIVSPCRTAAHCYI
jgi:hypothetical protein